VKLLESPTFAIQEQCAWFIAVITSFEVWLYEILLTVQDALSEEIRDQCRTLGAFELLVKMLSYLNQNLQVQALNALINLSVSASNREHLCQVALMPILVLVSNSSEAVQCLAIWAIANILM
jgi:hypothetical protein